MGKKYTIYRFNSGAITRTGGCPDNENIIDDLRIDESFLNAESDIEKQKVDISGTFPAIVDRSEMPAMIDRTQAAAGEIVTISNLTTAEPTYIFIDEAGFDQIVTDGVFEFTLDQPGTYTVKCRSALDLDKVFNLVII